MPLTDLQIRNAKPKAAPYKLSDGGGLYLLVKPIGSKLWLLKYRYSGKEKSLSIGQYPHISIAEAREKRFHAKKLLIDGTDPSAKKQEDKRLKAYNANNTFRAIAEDWHSRNKAQWSPNHAERLWRRLELYAFKDLGNRPITEIRTPELIPVLRKQEKLGTLDTARRLAQVLNVVFRYAVHCGLIDQNPASDLRGVVKPHKATSFPTIKSTELPEFFEKLDVVSAIEQNKIAVKLLMLTFLRPGELQRSKWTDIDFKEKQWVIPAERMKMRRPHMVPLSEQAITLLQKLKKLTGDGEYMFPSHHRRKHPFMSENTINHVLNRMGYKGKLVGHGFRSLASTTLNEESDFDKDVIEVQLSHMDEDRIRGIYNRAEYTDERRKMMQWWADYVLPSMVGHNGDNR